MVETHAADRAHGPCRDLPSLLSTVSAEVQGGVGGKARAARRPTGTARFLSSSGVARGPVLFQSSEEEPVWGPASTSA